MLMATHAAVASCWLVFTVLLVVIIDNTTDHFLAIHMSSTRKKNSKFLPTRTLLYEKRTQLAKNRTVW